MSTTLSRLPTWVLSSAATRSHQVLHLHLAKAGVTGYEYRCLAALTEHHPMSQVELGNAAALDPRDVTHTVRALELRGLVFRESDSGHGRRMLVSLTDEGSRETRRLSRVMDDVQDQVFQQLGPDERTTLLDLLKRIAI